MAENGASGRGDSAPLRRSRDALEAAAHGDTAQGAAPTPARVRVLPVALANQIAAGEVVERPASVVKELLENSLDAGARRVQIDVEQGGARLIRVRDDGGGIRGDDLRVALSRHATSKIASLDDLERIGSLGFRGEALPSIASVARLTLASRIAAEELGWQVRVEDGGTLVGPEPVAHPAGTTVEVRDLFFNTPARRRFLRAEKTEQRHIEDVVTRIALSRARLSVHLTHNGRRTLAVGAAADEASAAQRVARLCGRGLLAQALAVELEAAGLSLRGWVGSPHSARAQADLQYFFVNGRTVRDRVLGHAVRQAYDEALAAGRHPAYVLYLALDPQQVDVNVHPTKHEVRFRESRLVHDFVLRALRQAIEAEPEFVGIEPARSQWPAALGEEPERPGHPPGTHAPARAGAFSPGARPPGGARFAAYADLHAGRAGRQGGSTHAGVAEPTSSACGRVCGGLLHGRYLLAEGARGLALVDYPAARAAICRRRLEEGLAGEGVPSRPLLLPLNLALSTHAIAAIESAAGLLERLGLEIRATGPESVALRRIPLPLSDAPAELLEALVRELGTLLAQGDMSCEPAASAAENAGGIVALLARGVARAGAAGGGPEELDRLLRELEALPPGEMEAAKGELWVPVRMEDLAALFTRRGGPRA